MSALENSTEALREKVLDINIRHLQKHTGEISECSEELCQFACLADSLIFNLDGETERASFHIVGAQMKKIPFGVMSANRYDTDTTHVIHLWANEKSYDVCIPKDDQLDKTS